MFCRSRVSYPAAGGSGALKPQVCFEANLGALWGGWEYLSWNPSIMSALFDDAERFDSLIVVGDTVRRVKDGTEEHVGPGTYR